MLCGVVYIIGRAVYGMAYRGSGPAARGAGNKIFYPALITLLISGIASAVNLSGGVEGLVDFAFSFLKF